jgi:hypothetical protein
MVGETRRSRIDPARLVLGVTLQLQDSVGGLDDGGNAVVAFAGVGLLAALVMLGRRRGRSFVPRILLLAIGGSAAAAGGYAMAKPVDVYALYVGGDNDSVNAVVQVLSRVGVHIEVAPGAYLVGIGGAVVAIGAMIPWTTRLLPSQEFAP